MKQPEDFHAFRQKGIVEPLIYKDHNNGEKNLCGREDPFTNTFICTRKKGHADMCEAAGVGHCCARWDHLRAVAEKI